MTAKRNVKNASIMSGAVLLAVMFGYQAVSGGNLEGPGRQVWKDEPTITVKLSNGQEAVLKHVGIGMRAGTPGTWKNYLDPKDTLSDAMTYPESPNEALVPVYALSQYALEPEKLDRRDADPPGSSYNSPFLHSIGAQRNSLIRFTLVRQFDVDIFTAGARTKMAANGFPAVEGDFPNDMAPEDRKARIQFLNAYMKIGWFDKGDTIDFIFERNENRSRVTQIHHAVRSGGKVDRILYPTEAPGRMAYPEGSAHFITQIYTIWYGKNNDGADPGMSIARKTIIKGDQSIKF
jgi:hypothetical protein